METPNICPTCGHEKKAYWQALTPGLVNCLIKAIIAVHKNADRGMEKPNKFHWHRDLLLTNNESHNFQKLRIHGLIAHADKDNQKSGYWLITTRGGEFLRGEVAVPRRVMTLENHVVGHSKELLHINELKGRISQFQSEYAKVIPKDEIKMYQTPLFSEKSFIETKK